MNFKLTWVFLFIAWLFSRWMVLTLNTTLQEKRRWPVLAAHAGSRSLRLPPTTQGTSPRTTTHPHPIAGRGDSVAWSHTGSHPLAPLPLLPLQSPQLFLPLPWPPPFACLKEHRGARRSLAHQFLLLWIAEDAAWRRRAGLWGRT